MESPVVSIIIPTWNRENLIGETLDSVLSQTYQNWECIIVDDCSTDGTVEVVKLYCRQDLRFKFLNRDREPKGAPTCRNIGLDEASGKYVIFLDSDDLLAWWCLSERVEYLQNKPELDFIVFPVISFNKLPGDSKNISNCKSLRNDLYSFIGGENPWQTPSPIFRRNYLNSKNLWDEELTSAQESILFIKLLKKLPNYLKIHTLPDCFIRQHNGEERIANRYFWNQYCDARLNSYKEISYLLDSFKERYYFIKRLFNEARLLLVMGITIDPYEYLNIGKSIHLLLYYFFIVILKILIGLSNFIFGPKSRRKYFLVKLLIPKKMKLFCVNLNDILFQELKNKLEISPSNL